MVDGGKVKFEAVLIMAQDDACVGIDLRKTTLQAQAVVAVYYDVLDDELERLAGLLHRCEVNLSQLF